MRLRQRIELVTETRDWLNAQSAQYHYMHRSIHDRAVPFGWAISFDGERYHADGSAWGFIIFASIHYTKLRGEFGYPDLPTRWQVLSLARLWLHDDMPYNSETCVIAKALKRVQRRWLEVHPPIDLSQPYHVRKIISYADSRYHLGTIYKAANFRYIGETKSRQRHSNTRGGGMNGALLHCYIYDLPKPNWGYERIGAVQLPLLNSVAPTAR